MSTLNEEFKQNKDKEVIMENTTVSITKEHHTAMQAHMKDKGIKSFDFLIWKAFEQYIRKG